MDDRRKGREAREEGLGVTRAAVIKAIIFIAVIFLVAYTGVYALGGLETTRQLVIVFALTWLAGSFVGYNLFSPERGIAGAAALSVIAVAAVGVLVPVVGEEVTEENVKFFYRGSFTYLGPGENSTLTDNEPIESVNVVLPHPNTGSNNPGDLPIYGWPISIVLFDNESNIQATWTQLDNYYDKDVQASVQIEKLPPWRDNVPEVWVITGDYNVTEAGPKYMLQTTNLYPGETIAFTQWVKTDYETADQVTLKDTIDDNRSAIIYFRILNEDRWGKPEETILCTITSELHRDYVSNKIEHWTGVGETYTGHWWFLAKT